MHYNFIEIGTSNFNTYCQQASDNDVGISVEPIAYYLNQLPSRPFIKKINCAVSPNNTQENLEIFYIPEHLIIGNNLPDCLKGCNSIGKYHPMHSGIHHLVKKELIKSIPIVQLFIENDVTSCDLLKIDTEGSDSDILLHLFKFLKSKDSSFYPKKIDFECNELTPTHKVQEVLSAYMSLGYKTINFNYPCDECSLVLT